MVETPTEEKISKKSNLLGQKIKHIFGRIDQKIGKYGWLSLVLLLVLIGTIGHYENRERRMFWNHGPAFTRPIYMHQDNNWIRDIDEDFQNMQRQMDDMRARHEQMMRDVWNTPLDPKATTTSIVSNGDFQYSVNTKDGKLDGFVTTSDTAKATNLLAQIKGLGLTVDQKDSKLFFNGDAQKLNDLLKILGK